MANIHLYKNNPTGAGTDGQLVSEGDGTNPVSVGPLAVATNEVSSAIKLALRCETGYITVGDTVVSLTGTNAAKWAFAPDNAGAAGTFGAYGASLTITTDIDATNTVFWARAKAADTELPTNDTGVDIQVDCTITGV